MKAFYWAVFLVCLARQELPAALQSAVARAWCESVYLQEGPEPQGEFVLLVSGVDVGANNELFPINGAYSHHGYAYLEDQFFGDYIPGDIDISIPEYTDTNDDGFPDFFDSTVAISGTSAGTFDFPQYKSGTIQATWSRPKGSASGACTFVFKENKLTTWKTFTHTFLIMEYRGTVKYTPGSNTVSGGIQLSQTGFSESDMGGPLSFTKSATNKYNLLLSEPSTWTNTAGFNLDAYEIELARDLRWPTNYYGWLEFVDGDPSSEGQDFTLWTLAIDDLNDADKDGIPDFSDDPGAQVMAPKLAIKSTGTNFLLRISGTVNRVHTVEASASLAPGSWTAATNITLNTSPQTIALPMDSAGKKFWRVYAK